MVKLNADNPYSIQQARKALIDRPLRDYHEALLGIANYWQETVPTQIEDRSIPEVEGLLQDLHRTARQANKVNPELLNLISQTKNLVSELADEVQKRPGKTRRRVFFEGLDQSGALIRRLAVLVQNTSS